MVQDPAVGVWSTCKPPVYGTARPAPCSRVRPITSNGSVYRFKGADGFERTLIQSLGQVNGLVGRLEWIVDDFGNLTHQQFIKGGSINGVPNLP